MTRRTLNESELWLHDQIFGRPAVGEDTENLRLKIKEALFREIRTIIAHEKLAGPPFDPREIGKFRKVLDVVEDTNLTLREAYLVPVNGGFIIRLNPRGSGERKRFNCAHEVGHTFFFDLSISPPRRLYAGRSQYWVEEGYASEIAGEMLLPEPHFSRIALSNGSNPSAAALGYLKKTFDVSYDALSKRLLHDAHTYNKHFWSGLAWEAIILLGRTPQGDPDALRISIVRSPRYRRKLTNLRRSSTITQLLGLLLKGPEKLREVVRIEGVHLAAEGFRFSSRSAVLLLQEQSMS